MFDRAYSVLEIRQVQEDARIIEGVASTPTPDRMGDVVNPMGATFAVPMPLLWQHDSGQPIGEVTFAKATPKGIPFRAQLAKLADPGPLKDRLDDAWNSIKIGLVKAVSIGFRATKYAFMDDGGIDFQEWEWLELSAVTIPANADATITTIRSLDAQARAATGRSELESSSRPAPRSGTSPNPKRTEGKMPRTTAEQVSAFEATRQAKAAQMVTLMEGASDTGATLDADQSQQYDDLEAEVSDIDRHLVRLRSMQRLMVARATEVDPNPEAAPALRGGAVPALSTGRSVSITVPKGTAFTRYAMALMASKGDVGRAAHMAKNQTAWQNSTPEVAQILEAQYGGVDLERVMRAAVAPGTATDAVWAGPLVQYQIMASEFVELLRPATILGRIPGLTRVPFNVKIPRQTAGASVGWVGEAKPKPVSSLAFDTITLRWAKAAGIVVLSDELVRFSNPDAETLVQNDLIKTMAQFLDQQFTDPAVAPVANVSPGSITNGVPPVPSSGTDEDAFRTDLYTLIATFLANNLSTAGAVLLMTETQASAISMMLTPLGIPLYPTVTSTGGTLLGMTVVTSQNAGLIDTVASPATSRIIMLKAPEILMADDGQVLLDASREASLQMDSAPDAPPTATTVFMSLWQNNMVGLRAERWINWEARRPNAVQWLNNTAYGPLLAATQHGGPTPDGSRPKSENHGGGRHPVEPMTTGSAPTR
ncbi:MAG TPA: phage major capsid protein [Caulobacteraceae bacterium]|jgi:HK97 family phage major capsid protein/HK97 family phage prohead protease